MTQHVFVRRSQPASPLQAGTVTLVQSAPVHWPLTHTRPPHAAPLFAQLPVASQLCGWLLPLPPHRV